MQEQIQNPGGEPTSFYGPVARRISTRGIYPQRYQIDDAEGHCLTTFEVGEAGMIAALRKEGYVSAGLLVQSDDMTWEWGHSFALHRLPRQRGFRAEILTGPYHSPNGGLSATAKFVTIVGEQIPESLLTDLVTEDAPAVRMSAWPHRILVPMEGRTDGAVIGPMASGAFVYSSDSRWTDLTGEQGPLPLHDRYETAAQYNALSS